MFYLNLVLDSKFLFSVQIFNKLRVYFYEKIPSQPTIATLLEKKVAKAVDFH